MRLYAQTKTIGPMYTFIYNSFNTDKMTQRDE